MLQELALPLGSEIAVKINPRQAQYLFWAYFTVLSLWLVFSYGSLWRPLWLDEVLHVSFAALPSWSDALKAVHDPVPGVLTNQTGFYQLINFASVKVFGTSLLVFRFPSALAAILMLLAATVFLRGRQVSRTLTALGLTLFTFQTSLMYFTGEARPYMLFAASGLGVISYLSLSPVDRKRWYISVFGWTSLVLSALSHAYFWIVLPIGLLMAIWLHCGPDQRDRWSVQRVLRVTAPAPVVSAVIIAVVVAFLTWSRCDCPYAYDPFVFMKSWQEVLTRLAQQHYEFVSLGFLPSAVGGVYLGVLVLGIQFVVILIYLLKSFPRAMRDLAGGSILAILGISSSLIIALASYLGNYHILEKQWVFGMSITLVAFVWQVSALLRLLTRDAHRTRRASTWLLTGMIAFAVLGSFDDRLSIIREQRSQLDQLRAELHSTGSKQFTWNDVSSDPVKMANLKAIERGALPEVFSYLFELRGSVGSVDSTKS